mgnify:FL=1
MSRRFITGILAAAAVIAAVSAAPARAADQEWLGAILGTAAGLFILGKILSEADDGARAGTLRIEDKGWEHPGRVRGGYGRGRGAGFNAAPLPRRCLFPVHAAGTRYAAGARCLKRHYSDRAHLPKRCRARFERPHRARPVKAYALRCLRREGFTVTGRGARW